VAASSFAVVGAGIVGLAVARRLLEVRPGAEVRVVDKEPRVAAHQSGHNSGVVHAGVYYSPGSLKARLCRRGAELLKELCADGGLRYVECGKLIVARDPSELGRLRELESRARANGVPGIAWLGPAAMAEVEPHVRGVAALHSPHTAIVDYVEVAEALAADVEKRGGSVELGREVVGLRREPGGVRVVTTGGEIVAQVAVLCAGLQSDRVARLAGDEAMPAIVPFRGEYHRLVPERAHLVRGLIYPVPDPRYPFLGVHFTRRVSGGVDIGPNAVLALAREGYLRRDVRRGDLAELLAWPGFWRMARRHWRTGVRELSTSLSKQAFVAAARSYVPELSVRDVLPAPAGVRAQAVAADGTLLDDFALHRVGPVLAVRNAPSPAATSSLAIAEHLVGQLLDGKRDAE
jgi:L-2-hydroxyglutarate oxidase LhgO